MKTLIEFIQLAYKTYRNYFHILILSSIVILIRTLFSAMTLSFLLLGIENGNPNEAMKMLIFVISVSVFLSYLDKKLMMKERIHLNKMNSLVTAKISEKIMSLPFSYLEDPHTLELKKNAEMGVNNMGAVWTLCHNFFMIFTNILSLIGLGTIIFSFQKGILTILIVGIVINFILILAQMKNQIQFFQSLIPINFKYGYYLNTIISDKNGKDFRLYSNYELLYDRFNFFAQQVNTYFKKLYIKGSFYDSAISTVRYVQMAFIYILVGIRTVRGSLSVSEFSLTVSAALSFSDCISKIIESSSGFLRSIEYVKPMMELMRIETDKEEGVNFLDEIESIRFDHVSFTYPHAEQKVLDDISFEINKNEKISLVGLNGSGKTTIVKLLCRLYDPDEGRILINGKPIQQIHKKVLMEKISTVFQDYKMFAMSVRDNISLNASQCEIERVAEETGIRESIENLPDKWDSILSKSYDEKGVDLSGGQLQKIAITRALIKSAGLLILDEPTSALDPLAEAEIYENFNDLAKNRMALYISHRMSSSVFCDKILVLDHGKIVDFDTHANLMKKQEGLYYKLFHTQALNYSDS